MRRGERRTRPPNRARPAQTGTIARMALPATLRRFEIALADADRELYEQLDWRVAQHPSENARYLVAR